MERILYPITLSKLKLLQLFQFIKRVLSDIPVLGGAELFTDPVLNKSFSKLAILHAKFDEALLIVRKNEFSKTVARKDRKRDKHVSGFGAMLKAKQFTDDQDRLDAFDLLTALFLRYKGVAMAAMDYEQETAAIDNFVADCEDRLKSYYKAIAFLGLDGELAELKASNADFKSTFDTRIQGKAIQEVFDTKQLRKDLFRQYNAIANYNQALTVLHEDSPAEQKLYNMVTDTLNESRKYYADNMAFSDGVKETQKEKASLLTDN